MRSLPTRFVPQFLTPFAIAFALVACGPSQPAPASATASAASAGAPSAAAGAGAIRALALSNESLHVDKVGLGDGALHPDGIMDLAFTASIDGPLNALFLYTCDEKGVAAGLFRADTLVGSQEAPTELGGQLETGDMSVGIGVSENGKFINNDNGSVTIAEGPHNVTLYAAHTGRLRDGSHVCLYGRRPDGSLAHSPVIAY
jgi:hypothetical protein